MGSDSAMALNDKQRQRLPSTLARSPKKAQNTYIETLEAAEKQHGDGEAAHRIALASLKHSFEKVGDHWERKQKKGPSDSQGEKTGNAARQGKGRTAGGVDAFASKTHLMDVAKRLDIKGRSQMKKAQLVEAIDKANRSATAKSGRETSSS
jgi:cation transport regulator ChaB